MEKNVRLIYTLDTKNERKIILKEGTLEQIDDLTSKYNKEELISLFKNEIEEFLKNNREYIENKQIKTGNFIIINEYKKIKKVFYKKHKELFNLIIDDEEFMNYLDKNYTGTDIFFDDFIKYKIYDNRIMRKACKIYREEYKKQDKTKKLGGM